MKVLEATDITESIDVISDKEKTDKEEHVKKYLEIGEEHGMIIFSNFKHHCKYQLIHVVHAK